MDENLAGYLLKALDPDTERQVERYLEDHPNSRPRLERLQQVLDRLAADKDGMDPPTDLRYRTLARVAEYRCRTLPQAPAPSASQRAGGRSAWRRMDVVVAACLFLVLAGVGSSWLYQRWMTHDQVACQNNLKNWYVALTSYADQNGGALPKVEAQPPLNRAGIVVVMLPDTGFSVMCPANGQRGPSRLSLDDVKRLETTNPEEFQNVVRNLACCYAYSLGYREQVGDQECHFGLSMDSGAETPVMADRPPFDDAAFANSPNHAGRGQNVLFVGGQVRFCSEPVVNGDDIYHNRLHRVAAGLDRHDAVLGASNACPYPNDQ